MSAPRTTAPNAPSGPAPSIGKSPTASAPNGPPASTPIPEAPSKQAEDAPSEPSKPSASPFRACPSPFPHDRPGGAFTPRSHTSAGQTQGGEQLRFSGSLSQYSKAPSSWSI